MTKIAVSVIDMLNNGSDAAFANFYFTDVIPLYILYLKQFMKLMDYNYSYLPIIMNYTNAVFGTLIIIPAYILIKQLFGNATIAFCSTLALIFAPSFYQSTIMGFPHLIAFFFLLVSLCFYLSGLDHNRNCKTYIFMIPACVLLTTAFLFKSDYVLAAGIYIGFLVMRKEKDKGKIAGSCLMILISGILFLLLRTLLLGPSTGTTMSKEGLSNWYNYSLIIPSTIGYFIAQTKPIAYGAGIATFCMGIITLFYYLYKRNLDILAFIVSWAAVPTLFWLVMIGNNARHNMLTILPVLVIIVILFHEKFPKHTITLTVALIICNFLVTSPSFSILTPSGNLFKSNTLLENRMVKFQDTAKDITAIDENKIVVLGYFHNPHVVIDIMQSAASYKASKIGRENYRIVADGKEYVFIYFVVIKQGDLEEGVDYILKEYGLHNHVFVSATHDLTPLSHTGLKTITLDIIKRSKL